MYTRNIHNLCTVRHVYLHQTVRHCTPMTHSVTLLNGRRLKQICAHFFKISIKSKNQNRHIFWCILL